MLGDCLPRRRQLRLPAPPRAGRVRTVATDDATPGYIHGPMPAGTWNVILGLYKVPPQGADVILTITLDSSHRTLAPQPARTFPVRQGRGWYKGDLHCHTFHSDAAGSPETLHAAARQATTSMPTTLPSQARETMTDRRGAARSGGDADPDASGLQLVPQPVGIIAFVANQPPGPWHLGQEHQGPLCVAHLAW